LTTANKVIIGSRGSALALVQTNWVAARLREAHPGLSVEIVEVVTLGDRSQATNTPLSSYGEKGIFAKELEESLLGGRIDLAVHSMKDLAAELPQGLQIAAVPEREDPRDVVIGSRLADLASGAVIGTGSVRRQALLRSMRPDLTIEQIRGNVGTRIRKLRDGQFDAILLALSGLRRLGLAHEAVEILDAETFVPDPGQGALAIETRTADERTNGLIAVLNHRESALSTRAERAYLTALGAGCQTPVGAHAILSGESLRLRVLRVADGELRRMTVDGPAASPEALGRKAADLICR